MSTSRITIKEAALIHQKAIELFKENRSDEAILEINKSIELYPVFESALYNRGIMEQKLNHFKNAIKDFTKVIELNPENIDAYFSRGVNNFLEKEYREAINDFNFAINHDSQNPKTKIPYSNYTFEKASKYLFKSKCELAIILLQQDKIEQSVHLFEEVIQQNNNLGKGIYPEAYLISKLKLNMPDLVISSYYVSGLELIEKDSCIQLKSLSNNDYSLDKNDENFEKLIEYKIDYKIGFGKYSGEKIETVINSNPNEILSYIINLTHFSISNYILASADFFDKKLFITAVKINLLKSKAIEILTEEKEERERNRQEAQWEREEFREERRRLSEDWMDGDPENYWNID